MYWWEGQKWLAIHFAHDYCQHGCTIRSCSRHPCNAEMPSLREMPKELHRQLSWPVPKLLDRHSAASCLQNCYEKKISLHELDFCITRSQMHYLTIKPPTEQDNSLLPVTLYVPFSSLPMVKLDCIKYCTSTTKMSLLTSVNGSFFLSLAGVWKFSQKGDITFWALYVWKKCLYFALTLNWMDTEF